MLCNEDLVCSEIPTWQRSIEVHTKSCPTAASPCTALWELQFQAPNNKAALPYGLSYCKDAKLSGAGSPKWQLFLHILGHQHGSSEAEHPATLSLRAAGDTAVQEMRTQQLGRNSFPIHRSCSFDHHHRDTYEDEAWSICWSITSC